MRYCSLPRWALAGLALLLPLAAMARPAEGPPVVTAQTEAFEIVGRLEAHGLVLYVDQFATNQPVLDAKLSLESGGQRGEARRVPETGTYLVDAAPLLALWEKPGDHEISFTLITPQDSDLLLANLAVPEDSLVMAWTAGLPGAPRSLLILAGLVLAGLAYTRRHAWMPGRKGGQA